MAAILFSSHLLQCNGELQRSNQFEWQMMLIHGQNAAFSSGIDFSTISKKPLLVFPLNFRLLRERRNFNPRNKNYFSVSSVLSDNQIGSTSNGGISRLLEKELNFAPLFDDYVKLMESVKVERDKDSSGKKSAENGGKKKLVGATKTKKLRRDDNFDSDEKHDKIERSKNRENSFRREVRKEDRYEKGSTGGITDNETVGRDRTSWRDESVKNIRNGMQKSEKNQFLNRKTFYSKEESTSEHFSNEKVRYKENMKIVQSKQRMAFRDGETGTFKGNKVERESYRKVNDVKGGGIGFETPMRTFRHDSSKVTQEKFVRSNSTRTREDNERLYGENYDIGASENIGDRFYSRHVVKKTVEHGNRNFSGEEMSDARQTYGFNGRNGSKRNDFISTNMNTGEYGSKMSRKGMTETYDLDDRAAFKTYEVFTDVRNRPRVLRMELEERIKMLAKKLHAADINMPQWQFSKMIHDAKIKFTDHSILRVVQVLGTFGNWKRVLQVVEWLQTRERFKSYKSRYMYTTALDVLGKANRPIEALNIFYSMRKELSSYPDLASYHCIAVTLGQAGLLKELFDVIDCMRAVPEKKFNLGPLQKWDPRLEPDLVVYNAVLNACVQQKKCEGAFWVLQQLKEQGIKPSNTTHGLVMEVMLACEKYNLVYEFFRKVEKSSIPGALSYKVLVNALWREGKIDEAVLAVEDMERRGVVGSASLYYDLARCLCSAGRCQEALLQINKICKVAKKPLVVTYTGLIQACLDSGSIENGAFIFNEMQKYCLPNVVTCNIMLKSYIEHEMFTEAKDLFQKILDESHQIVNQHDVKQKVIPDKFTFNTMIEASAKLEKWDDFEYAYRQMLTHGFHFDSKRHLKMVLDAFRAGKGQVLELTWKHLARYGRVPPPPIIKERFCTKLVKDDHIGAISCITIHDDVDIHAFSEKSWLGLLYNNASRFKNATVSKLVHELKRLLAEKNQMNQVCQNLTNACDHFLANKHTMSDLPKELHVSLCDS